jgi:hypothetical protein
MRFDICNCADVRCAGAERSDPKRDRPTRRHVLGMLGTAVAGAALGGRGALAQGAVEWHVDTHHHIYPPRYVGANLTRIVEDSRALPASAYTSWSPALAIEQMDKA